MNYSSLYLLVLFFFSIKCIPTFSTFAILSIPIIERVSEDKFKSTKERIDKTNADKQKIKIIAKSKVGKALLNLMATLGM